MLTAQFWGCASSVKFSRYRRIDSRNLVLSRHSFWASVNLRRVFIVVVFLCQVKKEKVVWSYETSIVFHFRINFDFEVISAPMTALHSFDFNCSRRLVINRCFRVHRSISLRGPIDGCSVLQTKAMMALVLSSSDLVQLTLRQKYLEEHFRLSSSTRELMFRSFE